MSALEAVSDRGVSARRSDLVIHYSRTLDFVNREREFRGEQPLQQLPLGIRTDPCGCPVARGLGHGATVDGNRVYFGDSDHDGQELPDDVVAFVAFFDEGFYLSLIAGGRAA